MSEETLLKFPCKFPIKVLTENDPAVEIFIRETLEKHANMTEVELSVKNSSQSNYLSFSIILTAESKAQLDKLYEAFTSHEKVKMVL